VKGRKGDQGVYEVSIYKRATNKNQISPWGFRESAPPTKLPRKSWHYYYGMHTSTVRETLNEMKTFFDPLGTGKEKERMSA